MTRTTMMQKATWGSSFLVMLAIALSISPAYAQLPTSCQAIRDADPTAVDGEFVIAPNGQVFTVFCFDMAGTPREYLTLQNTGGSFNFAQFTAGGGVGGTTVRTNYTKVRLDPTTLLVNIGDQTFATSTGSACCIGLTTITSMPYGTASACVGSLDPAGRANIDLTCTPFLVNDTFLTMGFDPAGSVSGVPGQVVRASAPKWGIWVV